MAELLRAPVDERAAALQRTQDKEDWDREKAVAACRAAPAGKGGKGGWHVGPDNNRPRRQRDQQCDHSKDAGRYNDRRGGHQVTALRDLAQPSALLTSPVEITILRKPAARTVVVVATDETWSPHLRTWLQ